MDHLGVWAAGPYMTIATMGEQFSANGYTRQAFTNGGDSNGNDIFFRFVFQPKRSNAYRFAGDARQNFTHDVSWIHEIKRTFGSNIRLITNARTSFEVAFDNALTNPSFYAGAGKHVSDQFQSYLDSQGLWRRECWTIPQFGHRVKTRPPLSGRFSQFTSL